jgi:pimeloyl-ACP methyl ester carboxylesterase
VVRPTACYVLRRFVGVDGFWKKGLQSVWGDPRLVSDSDALRFQWPSIGAGWEDGLLRFARAMKTVTEGDLVRRVACRPNTRIVVILGSRDKVIPRKMVDKVFSEFPEIPILEIDGCGHDPFEENVDAFIDLIEEVLAKN